jgi:spore maturation protein CgeB
MSYRFVKVACFYDAFLSRYYDENPQVAGLTYEDQLAHLMRQGFALADHVSKAFLRIGVDALEIVENASPLQACWAREHGINPTDARALLLEQLKFYKPDVLFLQDPLRFTPAWIREMRKQVPSVRRVIAWLSVPYGPDAIDVLREVDFVFACTPGFVDEFRAQGLAAHYSTHAFEPGLLAAIQSDEPRRSSVTFTGSLFAGSSYHDQRGEMLNALLRHGVDVDIFGYLIDPPLARNAVKLGLLNGARFLRLVAPGFASTPAMRRVLGWQDQISFKTFSRGIKRRVREPVFGLDMLRTLHQSSISFNAHIGIAGKYAGNVRLFEATGAGSCLLTDWKENMSDLFEDGVEVVTYRCADECVEKARWLLDHPDTCLEIARAGQRRTLHDYNFDCMVERFDAQIRASMP